MNKRLILIIGSVLAVILLVVLALNIKKKNEILAMKQKKLQTISDLISQAKDFETKEKFLDAKTVFQRLISEFPNSNEINNWQRKLEDINIKLIFSPIINPGSTAYEIKPGDNLEKIAKEFNTTVELIKKSNGFSDDKILPGRKIKVWTTPFSILIDKSQNTLVLKTNDEIIKAYVVSTGANNSTPVGDFKIVTKLKNPTWFKAGAVVPPDSPENILGSRWIGFNVSGYGIHGTTEPQSLGQQVTEGCIRMLNSDVKEIYAVVPTGTEVIIVD